MKQKIPISFWGSGIFSLTLLEILHSSYEFQIQYIVTQPDKPRSSRNQIFKPTIVKQFAIENNIPFYTPSNWKEQENEFFHIFQNIPCTFHVVLEYGNIIPSSIFQFPLLEAVNFHSSLLPKLRGASPIQTALRLNFSTTGWTLQKLDKKLDTGNIIFQTAFSIQESDNQKDLLMKFQNNLKKYALEWLLKYSNKNYIEKKQIENEATYCSKLSTSDFYIHWGQSALEIRNIARSISPSPAPYFYFAEKRTKIFLDFSIPIKNFLSSERMQPGSFGNLDSKKNIIWIATKDLQIPVQYFQIEGKKKITAIDFYNGYIRKK